MPANWQDMLSNLAALAGIMMVWIIVQDHLVTIHRRFRSAIFGLILGAGAVLLMMIPFELTPRLIFDCRAALIACAGFFGGPLSAVIAGAAGLAFRIYLGGVGVVAGGVSIVIAMLVGVTGYQLLGRRPMGLMQVLLFGIAVSLSNLLGFFILPYEIWSKSLLDIGPPFALLNFIATTLTALVLRYERHRRELIASNMLYRATIEALPDCLNVKDLDGRFMAANPATAVLMRANSTESLLGKTDFDFFPQETAATFYRNEQEVIAAGKTVTVDQRIELLDGSQVWLSTLKAPMRDANDRLIGLITHNRDITEQKQLQQELGATRERLNDAMSKMSDGLVIFDDSGVLLYCNTQYRSFFPKTGKLRVPGAHYADILREAVLRGEITPDIGQTDLETWVANRFKRNLTESTTLIQQSNGTWLQMRSSRVKQGVMFIVSDITEQRKAEIELQTAEAEYRALFENSVGGIFRSTADGILLRANPALARLNGYETETDFLEAARDIGAAWYVDAGRRAEFRRMLERDGLVTDFVSEIYRHRTGERIWVSETAWIVPGARQTETYFEGTVVDVTERKQSEETLAEANRKLEELASLDGLTGLSNRRIFDQTLQHEFARRRRDGTPLSIVMIDVDRFKSYNDTYGHLAGDDCLCLISGIFKTVLRRAADRGCRYGGEELVAILPNTGAQAALKIAEAFRTGVKDLAIVHEGSDLGIVSISAGVATCTSDSGMADMQDLIREADRALYEAKRTGRDRVLPALAA